MTVENACDLAPKVEVWFNEFGTSIDRLIDLLKDSEQKLETAVQKGGDSPKLRHCKAQTLIHFADGHRTLGDTEQSLKRAKEASSLLERLVESHGARTLDPPRDQGQACKHRRITEDF